MKVLAVGAHFDDVELGCGGTIAKHASEGDKVFVYVVTNSGYTDYAKKVIREPEIAYKEGKKASEILGANLITGDHETMKATYNDDLICSIKKVVDENDIQLIYTHWHDDIHQDHYATARATLSAGRRVPRILMYRSNWYASTRQFMGSFYVDITEFLNTKIEAIKAHQSEYGRIGEQWLQFFLNQNQNDGQKIGVKYAESFEVVKYLR